MSRIPKQNPKLRRYAAAIAYDRGRDTAPRLVAKGAGLLAMKIIAAAKEAGVPVYEDPDLADLLMTLDINEMIPPELYLAVAEVLAFVYRLNGALPIPGECART